MAIVTTMTALTISACNSPDSAKSTRVGASTSDTADMNARAAVSQLPLTAIAALDAGNAAYRAKQLDQAIAHYREAATAAPNHAAPWFGLYMAANEMKNTALADSAMARVKALSSDTSVYNAHADALLGPASPGIPSAHPSSPPMPSGHPTPLELPPGHGSTTKPPTP